VIRRQLPMLTPCAHPGCKRLCHWRYCPEHADEDQRDKQTQLDEVRLRRDLALDEVREMTELAQALEHALGVTRG
jgi:hypothetical protein